MENLRSDDFLMSLYRKINRKKRVKALQLSLLLILIASTLSIQFTKMIYESKMKQLWSSYTPSVNAYEWDYIGVVAETESLEYLIDELDIDELVDFIVKEYDAKWLNSIKLEG